MRVPLLHNPPVHPASHLPAARSSGFQTYDTIAHDGAGAQREMLPASHSSAPLFYNAHYVEYGGNPAQASWHPGSAEYGEPARTGRTASTFTQAPPFGTYDSEAQSFGHNEAYYVQDRFTQQAPAAYSWHFRPNVDLNKRATFGCMNGSDEGSPSGFFQWYESHAAEPPFYPTGTSPVSAFERDALEAIAASQHSAAFSDEPSVHDDGSLGNLLLRSSEAFQNLWSLKKGIPEKPVDAVHFAPALDTSGIPPARLPEIQNLLLLGNMHLSVAKKRTVSSAALEPYIRDGVRYLNASKPSKARISEDAVRRYAEQWIASRRTTKGGLIRALNYKLLYSHFGEEIKESLTQRPSAITKSRPESRTSQGVLKRRLQRMKSPDGLADSKSILDAIVLESNALATRRRINKIGREMTEDHLPAIMREKTAASGIVIPSPVMQKYYLEAIGLLLHTKTSSASS